MAIFSVDRDTLKSEVDELRAQTGALRVEGDRLRNLLECFDTAGFDVFREKVLIPEQHRLERLRMEIPSDSIMVHERLVGQWAEANALATRKETLAQDLAVNVLQMREQGSLLTKAELKLERLIKKGD